MPRHAKNNTAAPTFTYGEKKALTGWGTQQVRLGGDSLKDFDACTLCLHQADEPLVCTKGHLFCKACIYECLLQQKTWIKTQEKLHMEQEKEAQMKGKQKDLELKMKEIEKFEKQETGIRDTHNVGSLPKKKERRNSKRVLFLDMKLIPLHKAKKSIC